MVGTFDVRVGTSWIDFGPYEDPYTNCVPGANPGACSIDGTTTGDVLFTSGDGSFTGINGTLGTVGDLEDDFAPVDSAFSLADWLTMVAFPTYEFTLTYIEPGSGTAAACTDDPGDVCTPTGSAFTLTNLADTTGDGVADSVSIAFVVSGTIFDGVGPTTMFTGRFSTQFAGSALELLTLIQTEGFAAFSNSANFEATIVNVVPEPATLLLFGTGAALIGASRRRRAKASRAA